MAKEKTYQHQEDLTEADRAVLRHYEDAKEPIAWDKSDDAILAFAASIHEQKLDAEPEADAAAEEPTVVPFRRPAQARPMTVFRSPVAGLAIAASLMIGVVVGQTVLPQFNEDQARDYAQVIEDNERLAEQLARFGDLEGADEYFQVLEENVTLQAEIEDLRRIDTMPGADQIGTQLAAAPSPMDLGQLLTSFSCASLTARTGPGGNVIVDGYVGSGADLTRLQGSLGTGISRAQVAAPPFCTALEALHPFASSVGGPTVRPHDHGVAFDQGESVTLAATASGLFGGYLYVAVLSSDGQVRQLHQDATSASAEVVLDGGQALVMPSGQMLAIAISTPQPLFEAARPETEGADAYLAALSTALEAQDNAAASHVFLTTN